MWTEIIVPGGPFWLGLSTSHSLQENYEVLGPLGHGRFGRVSLAKHRGTGMLVAVKELVKARVPAHYIVWEVEILQDLQHPNIVQLLEVIESEDKVYLVLEYVTGGNLRQRILRTENHRLPEEEARGVFQDIMGAMDYCHAQGIVHGDLKPQNVLINSQGHTKICDFGAGSRFLPGKEVAVTYGTLKYCAPERLLDRRYEGPPLDVWALGIILYELLTGQLPFNGDKTEMVQTMLSGRCSCPQSISRDAQDLIWNLLCFNPRMRPTAQEVLQHHWLQDAPPPSPELLPMPPQMAILNDLDGMGFKPLKVINSARRKEMATFLARDSRGHP
ncbi:Sperm motility kinase 3 [Heterocephalus glaber]|uniref:non-specific serine/threonine protein kinase n=1 Tax=Heterocephalus glaber TaxID=10181 RepID=G5AVK8_HETGA|nr:Sperm motility kinase 3 [Heterocephalus glaber]